MLDLEDLQKAITQAGGGAAVLEYAPELLDDLHLLEQHDRYQPLLMQLLRAQDEGNFRGRALEVNLAADFERSGIALRYEVSQGQPGNIDFAFDLGGKEVFVEVKLLGQDARTKADIQKQLEASHTWQKLLVDDTSDIARLQWDIFAKGSLRKFSSQPPGNRVNLVAIDVTELQLGAMDGADCILAAAGNAAVEAHFRRPSVVGVFEAPNAPTPDEQRWLDEVHRAPEPHLRSYLHGALFLFRRPAEKAALAYELTGLIGWNPALLDSATCASVASTVEHAIPKWKP